MINGNLEGHAQSKSTSFNQSGRSSLITQALAIFRNAGLKAGWIKLHSGSILFTSVVIGINVAETLTSLPCTVTARQSSLLPDRSDRQEQPPCRVFGNVSRTRS